MATQQTEQQKNCASCKKPIKKVKRYYRNGQYYCSKKCWRKSKSSKEDSQKA